MSSKTDGTITGLISQQELLRLSKRFHTKKHLGQHFLIDPEQLERITQALSLDSADQVLEIGPGLGFLTRFLCHTGASVTAVELDAGAVSKLQELNLPHLNVVHGDILRFDPLPLVAKLASGRKLKIAGNVPYQITSKIVAHLFGELDKPSPWLPYLDKIVLTVQLEVGRRFVAQAGQKDYSQITVLTSYYSQAKLLEVVPPESFYPPPQVHSAVVEFTPHIVPPVMCQNVRLMRQLVQAGFNQRRKMLRNNLSFVGLSPDELAKVFQEIKLDPQVRAERLSLEQFARLADCLEARMPKRAQHKSGENN